jgi:two-component system cell cycle sensor histidine kinase/response regulator CckA
MESIFCWEKGAFFLKVIRGMSSQTTTPCILVVDDDEMVRYILEALLSGAGYRVVEADSGEAAIQKFSQQLFPLVLMDMFMPGMGGPEALQRIREQWPETRMVLLSGAPEELKEQAQLKGVRCFPKPFDNQELLKLVREELQAGGFPLQG